MYVCTKFEGVSKGALAYMYVCCRRGEGEGERVKERERERERERAKPSSNQLSINLPYQQ